MHERDWHVGVLSRLPIVDVQVHTRPGIFTRKHLLEGNVEEKRSERAHLQRQAIRFFERMCQVTNTVLHHIQWQYLF